MFIFTVNDIFGAIFAGFWVLLVLFYLAVTVIEKIQRKFRKNK